MATNELYRDADSLPYIVQNESAPGADDSVKSGDLVVFASGLVGVAETDAVKREDGNWWATVRTQGVWGFPYTGALANAGVAVYASATPAAGKGVIGTFAGTTSASNTKIGTLYLPKTGSGAGTAYVRLGA